MNRLPAISEPIYTQTQINAILAKHDREARRRIWIIWGWSMLLTVMIAASVRRQLFIPAPWYVTPMVAVTVNALCFWLGSKIYFGRKVSAFR